MACAALAARCGSTSPSCTYLLTPAALSIPPTGGPATLTVTTGSTCAWTAVSNASWFAVLVTSPTRTGSGPVQIVAGPSAESPRTGTLTIAGQTVIVSQDAKGPVAANTLTGIVKEAWTDAGLDGVAISITSGPAGGSTTTDNRGAYSLTNLPAGVYHLSFSKPSFTTSAQTIIVFEDTVFSSVLNVSVAFPLTQADISGYWSGGGPYPNNPFRLTLIQTGQTLSGYYVDSRDSSDSVTGTYAAGQLALRMNVAGGLLTLEGTVDDERHVHGFIKNERLGGNFPITMIR